MSAVALAFFDLDLTLIDANSGSLWLKKEIAEGHVSAWQAARAFSWLLRYRLGFAGLEAAVEEAIDQLSGRREDEMIRRVEQFWRDEVKSRFRPGAAAVLAEHRRKNDRLILLTSASNYLGDHVMAELGLHRVLANRFEIDGEGRYTGRSKGTLCFGRGKLVLAEEVAGEEGSSLADASFYTDSFSDLPVLEAVGRPIAVNPDPRLLRTAEKRGWPIVDWGRSKGVGSARTEDRRAS
jgi:HAD superfamily hydrolase (TIGR01490 family)